MRNAYRVFFYSVTFQCIILMIHIHLSMEPSLDWALSGEDLLPSYLSFHLFTCGSLMCEPRTPKTIMMEGSIYHWLVDNQKLLIEIKKGWLSPVCLYASDDSTPLRIYVLVGENKEWYFRVIYQTDCIYLLKLYRRHASLIWAGVPFCCDKFSRCCWNKWSHFKDHDRTWKLSAVSSTILLQNCMQRAFLTQASGNFCWFNCLRTNQTDLQHAILNPNPSQVC